MNDFLQMLAKLDLFLVVDNDDLLLRGKKGKLTEEDIRAVRNNDEVISFITQNKTALVEYLQSQANPVHAVPNRILSIYPMTATQEGMLFHWLFDQTSRAYHQQFILDLSGDISPNAFVLSWQEITRRHSILRNGFRYSDVSAPVQCTYVDVKIPFRYMDWSMLSHTEVVNQMVDFLEIDRDTGFNLTEPPLMRLSLIKTQNEIFKFVWTHHHILLDGWSVQVIISEFMEIYKSISLNLPVALIQDKFEDYVAYLSERNTREEAHFWINYLDEFRTPSLLPFSPSSSNRNRGLGRHSVDVLTLDKRFTNELKHYASINNVTLNTLMQGVWGVLLSMYTGQKDVVFGVTVSGRPVDFEQYASRVGPYVNNIPLRIVFEKEQKVQTWLQSIQIQHAECREYQHTSITEIKKFIGFTADLFDNTITFQNYPTSSAKDDIGFRVIGFSAIEQTNYLLSLTVSVDECLTIKFSFDESLIAVDIISDIKRRVAEIFRRLANGNCANVGDLLSFSMYDLTHLTNQHQGPLQKPRLLLEAFSRNVLESPASVALRYRGSSMSYDELDKRSLELAIYLTNKKFVSRNDRVGLFFDRSPQQLISLLAVLKLGAAFVPIDPSLPDVRVQSIIQTASIRCVITNKSDCAPAHGCSEIVSVVSFNEYFSYSEHAELDTVNDPHSLAYVIFTSGTTGIPKGVMVEQQNLAAYLKDADQRYANLSKYHAAYFTPLSFDLTLTSIFLPLYRGGSITIIPESSQQGLHDNVLQYSTCNLFKMTPSHIEYFINGFDEPSVDPPPSFEETRFVIGGEQFDEKLARRLQERFPGSSIFNEYGPTECTVGCTAFHFKNIVNSSIVPIGSAFSTTSAFILDDDLNPVPFGVIGELFIGGAQVARGYINNPELTEQRFVEHPMLDGRLYRTGDLAKWILPKVLEFVGRKDTQVKIRGYRIELSEISTSLGQCSIVTQQYVTALGHRKDILVAYVILSNGSTTDVVSFLASRLPHYMIPKVIQLDVFPLTRNGKIDTTKLPELLQNVDSANLPATDMQQRLITIWSQVLAIPPEKIGINDSFFDLGGHSLLVTRTSSALKRQLQLTVPLKILFELRSIAELEKYILLQTNHPEQNASTEVYEL